MKQSGWVLAIGAAWAIAGCAGHGEVVALNLRAIPPADATVVQQASDTIVVVTDFEDARPEKRRLGVRTHAGGGESYFNVPGGKAGGAVAQVVADYLTQRGWRAEVAKPGASGGTGPDGGPHVTISGKILDLSVDTRGSFGSTKIEAAAKTVVEALNAEDGSIVRMTLSGTGTQTVVSFDPQDAQDLLSSALSESLEKFVAETKFEKKSLRLR